MKFNHFCLIAGIFVIILAMTTFANAATYTFDCSSAFNCSIKSYCQGVSGAVPGLLVDDGEADSYTLGPQPIDYSFSSSIVGEHVCSARVTVTAMHSQNQTEENTTVYVNGVNLGTTSDNYCNGGDSENCTFCGRDTQTLPSRSVTLNSNNTLRVYGHDSHAVVAVILTCNPTGCALNSAPRFEEINNISIRTNSTRRIDLWRYIDDDESLNDLTITQTTSGTSVSCTVEDNRYLECTSTNIIGNTTITLNAVDDCSTRDSESFTITVYNNPPALNVPDQIRSCASNLVRFINLRNYSVDEDLTTVTYSIISQSNTSLMNCSIENGYYLTCDVNSCAEDYSDINISITDNIGYTRYDVFRLTFENANPTWRKNLPNQCINEDNDEIIDLNSYAYDLEDQYNLNYTITSQSNTEDITCTIENNRYLACENISNKKISNLIRIRATDQNDGFSESQVTISTNCFTDGNEDKNIIVESDLKGICLEKCTSYATEIKVSNYSGEKQCFDFGLDIDPSSLDVSLSNSEFCLNNKETTYMALSANTCGADIDDYDVEIIDEDQNVNMTFEFRVGTCRSFDGFRLEEFDGKICQGEKREFEVTVRNTSDTTKTIYLNADNSMVLPYFSKEKVTLEEDDETEVNLVINARTLALGKYNITIGGDAPNYHIEKQLDIEVVDCEELNTSFIITAPEFCYNVSKGQQFEGSFKVKRVNCDDECCDCDDEKQGINLFLDHPFYELSNASPELSCYEEKKISFLLQVPQDAQAGINFIPITGVAVPKGIFDDDIENIIDSRICINVAGETNAGILLKTETKDIEWCDSEIFELEITNIGDLDENFELKATNLPQGISVSFSEDKIFVKKGTTKTVYVSISTSPEAKIQDYQSVLIKLLGRINLSTEIYFNVKEKASFDDLEILSATKIISTYSNSETTYSIMLKNNTERDLRDIKVTFEDVPKDVNFEEITIPLIAKDEIVSITGKLTVGDINGYFEPTIIVRGINVVNKKKIGLLINENDESIFSGLFGLFGGNFGTGLFLFGGNGMIFGLPYSLILILVVVLLVLGVLSLRITKSTKKEVWMEGSNYE